MKFYMDRVLQEPAESYKLRFENDTPLGQGKVIDGKRVKIRKTSKQVDKDGLSVDEFVERTVPHLVRPDNVFRFATAGASKDNHIKHPAPFNKELPSYYINLLTDEGDVVLDPFSGIATTGMSCLELNRFYIGYELNETYCDFSIKRLQGDIGEKRIESFEEYRKFIK
jgi:DNA modification methylase